MLYDWQVTVTFPAEDENIIRRAADKEGLSLSDFIRQRIYDRVHYFHGMGRKRFLARMKDINNRAAKRIKD